jgi:hypothetical protein
MFCVIYNEQYFSVEILFMLQREKYVFSLPSPEKKSSAQDSHHRDEMW